VAELRIVGSDPAKAGHQAVCRCGWRGTIFYGDRVKDHRTAGLLAQGQLQTHDRICALSQPQEQEGEQ
jgi:hypothetical protein